MFLTELIERPLKLRINKTPNMIFFVFYTILISLVFLLTFKLLLKTTRSINIPPGPPYLPIIGNLHQLKKPLHHTFHHFSQCYGQIFSLRFGSRLAVVISSSSAVQECFTKNDIVLANRPRLLIGKYLGYNYTNILFSPYGDHWRNLRRITVLEVLSTHRINIFSEMRKDEMKRMVRNLAQDSYKEYAKVEMKSRLSEMTFNTVMRMISGKTYWGDDESEVGSNVEEAKNFKESMKELVKLGGANNPGEFLPIVRLFDFDGLEKKLKSLCEIVDAFAQGLINEHRNNYGNQRANTMIDHLLTMQKEQPEYYTDHIIKGLIMVIIFAGTETSSITLEWALSSLLNHPEVLKKAKEEIDTYIGQEHLIDEPDISKLPYLQNIISETLRLYPAAPLLIPHLSADDCTIGGYDVPCDTMVLVNVWSIHRDPQLWSNPLNFKPERFEKEGEAKKLIPFGLGRRTCPGVGLAQRTMGLTLGLLIQCFEWKRVSEREIDMTEGVGQTMPKSIPLEAMCKARHPMINNVIFENAIDN